MQAVQSDPLHDIDSLYADHSAWLFAWLSKKLACPEEAADVLHDTFMRVLDCPRPLEGVREPRAYLTTTAKHLMIDRARRRKVEDACLDALTLRCAASGHAPSPEQHLAQAQVLQRTSAVLDTLSSSAREAIRLRYIEGQSQACIAETLGKSTRMVRKYLVQAAERCAMA
ncbi:MULTISPECIES: sigma-70 family RNA polymerase sigma factor [Ralstonia]|uniref:Probable RNA polymerase sigma factor fecI n=1 Tax=Ralstonia mannitolilytica TaxID=105219 RepID=A0AAJ5D4P7_9RALS|nr:MULTISPECIES: sigma-70 family RNA polymerase sigma factor [Ralstonia]AJW45371.1 hypothetical protein TK49_12040 [Ralstonia mannitolilytica]MBU9579362.1 sigma-70 family RNA polymerase sigma factor [Ralstonia mannitolilytica]PLT19276.1 RNA polymerase subunit sigma [Ralstonia mannitolilytica]QIF07576.1 sigma-70 family RNA polymerase sigma factor [Ralstonia mannitolilytica]CAG2138345.1 putative RNA polymerase sigma factor FecI [Ralstonia mannitolilytica]